MTAANVNVAEPTLPPLSDLLPMLEVIWSARRVTNDGPFLQRFETALAEYLQVEHVSVLANGTLALLAALDVLGLSGEVITTPFTFVATTNALRWRGIKPVFADIDPLTLTLDPQTVEAAITKNTTAILDVHVFGRRGNSSALTRIADRHGLKVIYDGAHAFGVRDAEGSVLRHGDAAVMSFHATKVLNTLEGGGVVCRDASTKQRVDQFKNFGLTNGELGSHLGINGKMNEVQAAIGLLQLRSIDADIAQRHHIDEQFRRHLAQVAGLRFPAPLPGLKPNYSYFPVFIDSCAGAGRDRVRSALAAQGIVSRPYFYPLTSDHERYRSEPSAAKENLPIANRLADEVLCLPIHTQLDDSTVERICRVIARTQLGSDS